MSPEFIAAAKAEESVLVQRLDAVRALLAAYGAPPAVSEAKERESKPAKPDKPAGSAQSAAPKERVMDKFTPYNKEVVDAAVAAARKAEALPIRTRDLAEAVQATGIVIRGNDPVNALGALLHRCSAMRSLGKQGWTLADVQTTQKEQTDRTNENGALNGQAASAPEAGEAATSPVENRGWQAYHG